MNHTIRVFPSGSKFDWLCSCGQKAARLAVSRDAADTDALKHTPSQNTVTRYDHR